MTGVITRLIIDLSEEQIAIVDEWRANYLTPGLEDTRANAIRDMLLRISDDMREMTASTLGVF